MRQGAVVLAAQHGQHPETVWAAAEEASRRGALLRVVHAAPDDRRSRALVADVREVLRTLRWRAEVEVDVVEADPVEVLLTESDDASLLVLGVDHGPGGPRPWRHHSVLDAVALAARCPTIAVPSRLLGAGHSAGIVVAIDEVATAHGLLDFAFDAARRRG
ncbi:MAG: universal stress protein, partial [Actinomycetales bacterium]